VCGPHKVSFQAIFKPAPRAFTSAGVSKKKFEPPEVRRAFGPEGARGFPKTPKLENCEAKKF
jgi:hypothetical protein